MGVQSNPPLSIRARAIHLRQQGLTYSEIQTQLGRIPKGTLAYWFRGIVLDSAQQQRIQQKILDSGARGRPLAVLAWQRRIATWQRGIEQRVLAFQAIADRDPTVGKIVCGIMYACEGARYPSSRCMMFGNTNSVMIEAFLRLMRRHFEIDESKFRVRIIHRWDQDGTTLVRFWSKITRIPVRQFYPTYRDKRTKGQPTRKSAYKGVCCLQYLSTDLQYELQALGETVMQAQEICEADRT